MVDFMKEIVVTVILQELLSRAISFALEKRKEKVSQEEFLERIRTSVDEMEFALQRSRKLPITDISLLRRRKEIQAACILGRRLLNTDETEQEVKNQPVTRPSFHGWITCHGTKFPFLPMLGLSKEGFLKSSDARAFERHADSAGKFLRDVESGCSLWHHTFCCPLVRHLLEGKSLIYASFVKKPKKIVLLYLYPVVVEGRGIEVKLCYFYKDRRRTLGKYFQQEMILRISEDTDIIGITIKCMQWLASLFKLAVEPAIGELTLLPNVHHIFDSFVHPLSSKKHDKHVSSSTFCRREPICCNGNSNGTLANKSSIEIPEPVIEIVYRCYISGPKNSLRNAPVLIKGIVAPHFPCYTNGEICIEYGGKEEKRNGSLQQLEEIARSDGLDYLVHEPVPTDYFLVWLSPHGFATVSLSPAMPSPGRRVPKRKR